MVPEGRTWATVTTHFLRFYALSVAGCQFFIGSSGQLTTLVVRNAGGFAIKQES